MNIGDTVLWGEKRWTVWSLHPRRGYYWLSDETGSTIEARATSCTVVESVTPAVVLKALGQAHALNKDGLDEWKAKFRATAKLLAERGDLFTSEDIVDLIGLPSGQPGMNANNAVGAMMTGLAKTGVIRSTGRYEKSHRPSSHGAVIVVWKAS